MSLKDEWILDIKKNLTKVLIPNSVSPSSIDSAMWWGIHSSNMLQVDVFYVRRRIDIQTYIGRRERESRDRVFFVVGNRWFAQVIRRRVRRRHRSLGVEQKSTAPHRPSADRRDQSS